jgi:hypothetical protein
MSQMQNGRDIKTLDEESESSYGVFDLANKAEDRMFGYWLVELNMS